MANTIKIKRSDTSPAAAPSALARGELAYQEVSNTLYIGSGNETAGEAANRPVVAGPLNFMPAPTASVSMSSQKITSLATPTLSTDAANKAYVDANSSGLDVKESVRLATTAGISGFPDIAGAPTIDGVTVQDGDRVLVKDQSTASENGIWTWTSSGTIFVRATDFDTNTEVTAGAFTFVEEGTANADSGWVLTTNDDITVGSTGLAFAQFSGAGQITAGDGLTKTGNTLKALLHPSGGAAFLTHASAEKIAVNLSAANIQGTLPAAKVSGLITNVGAGVGLSGGGTSGTVTLAVDLNELGNGSTDPVGADHFVYVTAAGDSKKYSMNDVPLTAFDDSGFLKTTSTIDGGTY